MIELVVKKGKRRLAVIMTFVMLLTSGVFTQSPMLVNAQTVARPGDGGDGGGVTDTGFMGEYFANNNLSGMASFIRKDVRIDFDWETDLPIGGSVAEPYKSFPKDNFSVRWTGQIIPKYSEEYTFNTYGDAGVRVWIKAEGAGTFGNTVIDNWASAGAEADWSAPGTFTMVKGQKYDIKAEYRELTGSAAVRLVWSSPSTPQEVIDPVVEIGYNPINWGQAFTDIAKCGRNSWLPVGTSPAPTMDADGWPQGDACLTYQESMLEGLQLDPLMEGTIAFSFKGKATVTVNGNVAGYYPTPTYNPATNTTTGTFSAKTNGAWGTSTIFFKNTSRDGTVGGPPGITDLKLMRPTAPNATTSYSEDTLFVPQFKNLYSNFTVLRVDLNNGNQEKEWSDRTLPSFFNQRVGKQTERQFSTGAPKNNGGSWEHRIMLCNELGKDLYINIPVSATGRTMADTESYVNKLANLIKYGSDGVNPYTSVQANPIYPPLNPNLRVYIELSNELWNWANDAFAQYWDLEALMNADVVANNEDFQIFNYDNMTTEKDANGYYKSLLTWKYRKAALRMVQISNIFRGTFGDGQMMSRIRPIYEWQYANGNKTASIPLTFLDNYFNNADGLNHVTTPHPVNYYLWGGGGAAYFAASNRNGLTDILQNGSFETPVVSDYTSTPAGSGWTFSGTAGIAQNPSSLGDPNANAPDGTQVAYIQGIDGVNGSMSMDVTIPSDAKADEVYAIDFKAVNRTKPQPTPIADTQKVKLSWDGVDICQKTFSQKGGYQPPGYRAAGSTWKAQNVNWAMSDYYFTQTFTAQPGTTHTLKIEGISTTGDQTIFIDDVRLCSASAIGESEIPYAGQALGQISQYSGYQGDLNIASIWAKTYGLKYIVYEAGWSLGGDDGGSPLQNYCKYRSSETKTGAMRAIDQFHQSGGKIMVHGTYYSWPSWSSNYGEEGLLNPFMYPLIQAMDDRSDHLPAEVNNGTIVPAVLDGANCLEKKFVSGSYTNLLGSSKSIATYAVRTDQSGEHNFSVRLKTKTAASTIDLLVNQDPKQTISITQNSPYQDAAGNSNTWPLTVRLEKGLNIIRLCAQGSTNTDIQSVTIHTGAAPSLPLTAKGVPGNIEAEDYDTMQGIQTETNSDIGGGMDVTSIDTGDWMTYSVQVVQAGDYRVTYSVAAANDGGQVQLQKEDGTVLATTDIPNTGGTQAWEQVSAFVNLEVGPQVIKVYAKAGGWNLNRLKFNSYVEPPELSGKFVFGTTDVPGYTRVGSALYNSTAGYGWVPTPGALGINTGYRTTAGPYEPLYRNFAYSSSGPRVFQVDLHDGDYYVKVVMGDATFKHDTMNLDRLVSGDPNPTPIATNFNTEAQEWKTFVFKTKVTDGILQLKFSNNTAGVNWVVNTVEISQDPFRDVQAYNLNIVTKTDNTALADGNVVDTSTNFRTYVYLENTTNLPQTVCAGVAVYDNANTLKKVSLKDISLNAYEKKIVNYNIGVGFAETPKIGWRAKSFIWDRRSSMIPLNAAYTFTIAK